MSRAVAREPVVLVCLFAVLVSAACGGGNGGGDELTLADWVARADAACADGNSQLEELSIPASADELTNIDAGEFSDLMSQAADVGQAQLNALRDLNPPPEAAEDFGRLLDLTGQQVDTVRELSEAEVADVPDLFAELARISQEADAIIEKYPFEEC